MASREGSIPPPLDPNFKRRYDRLKEPGPLRTAFMKMYERQKEKDPADTFLYQALLREQERLNQMEGWQQTEDGKGYRRR